MKTIHKINQIILITTLVLYLTIFLGLMMQIVLGFYQILATIIILIFYKDQLDTKAKKYLLVYILAVIIFAIVFIFFIRWESYFLWSISTSYAIALFHSIITKHISKLC